MTTKNDNLDDDRQRALEHIFSKPLWEEQDLAILLDVAVDTIRHMKVRNEIPAIVCLNKRTWRVHRDAFLEHFKQLGMPKRPRGRPRKSEA